MRLDEVAPELIKRVAQYRWDRIVEKHEGPWQWDSLLDANLVEFLNVNGFAVLLPVGKERHPSIGNSNARNVPPPPSKRGETNVILWVLCADATLSLHP